MRGMSLLFDKPRAAIVEPDICFAQVLAEVLDTHFNVRVHSTYAQFERDAFRPVTDVVIGELGVEQEGLAFLESLPRISAPVVLFITASTDARAAVSALRAGALDYVFKPVNREDAAVLARRLTDEVERRREVKTNEYAQVVELLSPRERQVLELVGRGLSTKEIAQLLILSPRTVDAHRAQIISKTGVRRSAELIVLSTYLSNRAATDVKAARKQAG
jgi:FixJ family two-component response regulator